MKKTTPPEEIARIPVPATQLRLILVRHGESKANVAGVLQGQSEGELTARGFQQADQVGAHLQALHIDRMLVSDLRRARETAAQISRHVSIPIEYTAQVREWNAGILDGQPAAALPVAVRASGKPFYEFKPQGGERLLDVFERARQLIESLGHEKRRETVLVVSHGDFLRMVLAVIQEISLEEANRIHLENTSYTIAELDSQGKWKILTLNNSDHLKAN